MDELRRREEFAEQLGGPERVERQHAGGRYTIRERIAKLVDPGAFTSSARSPGAPPTIGTMTSRSSCPPTSCSGGPGSTGGPVVIGGDDFTVRGGSADATIKGKHFQCEQMAKELRLPLVRIVEGSGGGGSVKTIETTGRANVPGVSGWELVVDNMGTVPRVALGLGSVAGLGAAHLAAAHYSVMVKDTSALFVAGPPVVERLGQKLTKNELGGWQIQLRAGAVDDGGRHRRGRLRVREALPLLLAVLRLRPAAARPRDRRPRAARGVAGRRDSARPAQGVQDARDRRGGRGPGLVLRDRRALRPLHHHRARAHRRLAGGDDGERPVPLRRRVDRGHLPEGRALGGHGADLPPAGRLSRGLPGLSDRARGRADGHDQAGRARDVGHLANDGAVVRRHHPQRLRRGGGGPQERRPLRRSATRGRRGAGARCRSRAASRRPTAPISPPPPIPRPSSPRSRTA